MRKTTWLWNGSPASGKFERKSVGLLESDHLEMSPMAAYF